MAAFSVLYSFPFHSKSPQLFHVFHNHIPILTEMYRVYLKAQGNECVTQLGSGAGWGVEGRRSQRVFLWGGAGVMGWEKAVEAEHLKNTISFGPNGM